MPIILKRFKRLLESIMPKMLKRLKGLLE